jgi:hypothetical protein
MKPCPPYELLGQKDKKSKNVPEAVQRMWQYHLRPTCGSLVPLVGPWTAAQVKRALRSHPTEAARAANLSKL